MTEEFFEQMLLLSMVMVRMSGFVLLNPILGRRGIPSRAKAGMIFALTLAAFPGGDVTVSASGTIGLAFVLLKEFAVGYLLGFTIQLFTYVMTHAGSIIDFQMGLSMAMVYDPVNGTQTAVTGTMLNVYYILLFFAVDGHLALMKILVTSAQVVPYGQIVLQPGIWQAILDIFKECTILAIKLSFPLIAVELLLQVGIGILMKMVPQINLFVMNLQLKLLVGIACIIFLVSPIGDFIGTLITDMLNTALGMLRLAAG